MNIPEKLSINLATPGQVVKTAIGKNALVGLKPNLPNINILFENITRMNIGENVYAVSTNLNIISGTVTQGAMMKKSIGWVANVGMI